MTVQQPHFQVMALRNSLINYFIFTLVLNSSRAGTVFTRTAARTFEFMLGVQAANSQYDCSHNKNQNCQYDGFHRNKFTKGHSQHTLNKMIITEE